MDILDSKKKGSAWRANQHAIMWRSSGKQTTRVKAGITLMAPAPCTKPIAMHAPIKPA
jgi:hypothetical protein